MSQKICIIRRAYYPLESHVRRNAETLLSAGYSIDLICLRGRGQPAFEIIDGVNVHRLPLKSRRGRIFWYPVDYLIFFLLAFIKVTRLQLRNHFAIVEVDSMPDFLVFASLIPRLQGARIILYLFESMPELWAQKTGMPMTHWMIRLIKWQERISCLFADAVICCHELACDALVRMGVPEGKITVILNVPDNRVYQQRLVGDNSQEEDGVFNIVQHGTITENYGIQVVIHALTLINPAIPVLYNVVGFGEHRPKLEEMVSEFNLQKRVTFHGYVTREHLLEILYCSDIGVVPMLFEYQSPNKLFELITMGIPVIASDLKTFRQHFSDEEILYFETGNSEDLAEAIKFAVQHPDQMAQQAQRARHRFQNYSWEVMKERYIELYKKFSHRQ